MTSAMNYIETLTQVAKQREDTSDTQWLAGFRRSQLDKAAAKGFPTRKTEHFKYNNLTALSAQDLSKLIAQPAATAELPILCDSLNFARLVIIDGQLSPELSHGYEQWVTAFAEANAEQQAFILELLEKNQSEKNVFSQLNNALTHKGYLVDFATSENSTSLHVVYISTAAAQASSQHEQLVVKLPANQEATLIEHFVSQGEDLGLRQQSSHFSIGDNAKLNHYRLHLEDENHIHFGENNVWLNRDSQLNSFHLALGSKIKRIDINAIHQANGSHAEINGLYLARGKQQVDYHTNIEHRVAHCTSNEVFRGLIGGSAKGVFNGRIHIYADAQKTLAEMSNKNLLLSNKAEINTKPELEIYADDVRCAHGATVAQMDKKAMFYLLSRGIPKQQAELMLSFGFVNELLNDLSLEQVADYLMPILTAFFNEATA